MRFLSLLSCAEDFTIFLQSWKSNCRKITGMRFAVMMIGLLLIGTLTAFHFFRSETKVANAQMSSGNTMNVSQKVDFDADIKPILQARCQPCHFQGGKVYDKLPFDKPETITKLGTKLFTRIKDEKEQRLIREFLDQ